ncbi:hypothetical protein F2Q69_00016847 [Brassica cretica]|uniref:Uncharacterized protein n=1 Tax=Brassica cretica TaxID=69181 RepID=A0A8S9R817_BRACR|nr:hypothetical protein F2Q69_00016847 [Brassica cretica]
MEYRISRSMDIWLWTLELHRVFFGGGRRLSFPWKSLAQVWKISNSYISNTIVGGGFRWLWLVSRWIPVVKCFVCISDSFKSWMMLVARVSGGVTVCGPDGYSQSVEMGTIHSFATRFFGV